MNPEQLVIALSVAAVFACLGAAARTISNWRSLAAWTTLLVAAVAVAATVWVAHHVVPGRNVLLVVWRPLADRRPVESAAALVGLCLGVAAASLAVRDLQPGATRSRWLAAIAPLGLLSAFGLGCLLAARAPLEHAWRRQGLSMAWTAKPGWVADPSFVLEELCTCEFQPIQIAVGPDGDLYACYCDRSGGVARIHRDETTGQVTIREIAAHLNRPQGLAFHDGELYVSRAGRYVRAEAGRMIETDTGAVTRLRDLDGDGQMDFYEDVVVGLPGAQGPDPVHQNNGLAIAPDGAIYVTQGSHADRAPASGRFEGTIVRVAQPGAEPEVFARGMRNPFDIVLGPEGELFCTDNDIGFEHADELNHVIRGGHYGHPYADERTPHPAGSEAPIWTSRSSSLQGLCYCDAAEAPADWRGALMVVGFGPGDIYRVRLQREGATFRAESRVIARIPQALDVTCDAHGTLYVSAYASSTIYRIHHVDASR